MIPLLVYLGIGFLIATFLYLLGNEEVESIYNSSRPCSWFTVVGLYLALAWLYPLLLAEMFWDSYHVGLEDLDA